MIALPSRGPRPEGPRPGRPRPGGLRRGGLPLVALFAAALAFGCRGPNLVPTRDILEPLASPMARPPTPSDLAAARLATAALAATPADMSQELAAALSALREAEAERIRFERIDRGDAAKERTARRSARPKGPLSPSKQPEPTLIPLGRDVVNATLDDSRKYRVATRELLTSSAADPSLRERLDQAVRDDPLELAQKREIDSYERDFARTFNAISEPLGQALMLGVIMAPYTLALSAGHWVAGFFEAEPLDTPQRQALAHRKRFLAEYPDDPNAPRVRRWVERDDLKLKQTFRDRDMDVAQDAWKANQPRLTRVFAERALLRLPEDGEAKELDAEARTRIAQIRERLLNSLGATEHPLADVAAPGAPTDDALLRSAQHLARSMLLPGEDITGPSRKLLDVARGSPLEDEARFGLALGSLEAGSEDSGWTAMRKLGRRAAAHSNMSRHASLLASNPHENPYRAFVTLRGQGSRKAVASIFLGSYIHGRRYKKIPAPIAWTLELPAVVQTILVTPLRIIFSPWTGRPDFQRPTSIAAYRYLTHYPQGQHGPEVLDWLHGYLVGQENWSEALRVADFQPGFDPKERDELVEKSAKRRLELADTTSRRDVRASILRELVREYPDAESGREAGYQARAEVENISLQRIRMTRGFLEENPLVAGPRGLGVRDALLDGQLANGELHPKGITFLGGRWIEFNLVDRSGDEDEDPVTTRKQVSGARLQRTVVLVEEITQRNSRLDPDDELGADAQRDLYFERARLGLLDQPDARSTAESTYVFEGVRERYGMVRGRDSVLPFDLVLQGSFDTLGLAAFPRWRMPEETPDAFLYR